MFLGRSLTSAVSVALDAGGNLNRADSVNANQIDVFRLNLLQRSSVNLLASGLSGDVNVAIVRDGHNGNPFNNFVEGGEILASSSLAGLTAESVQLNDLQPGNYFIIVGGVQNANYTLDMTSTRVMEADILWRDEDKGQVGYWRFDGTQYRDTKFINSVGQEWKVEAMVSDRP